MALNIRRRPWSPLAKALHLGTDVSSISFKLSIHHLRGVMLFLSHRLYNKIPGDKLASGHVVCKEDAKLFISSS